MKKINKNLLLAATALLSVSGLAGCGGKADTGHTIRVWTTFNDDYGAVIAKAITKFQTKYPDYKVEYTKQSGSYDDLKSMTVKGVAAGDYADLVVAYPDSVADFILTGKALDITDLMNSKEQSTAGEQIGFTEADFEDIPQAYLDEGKSYFVPGTFSMPLCKSTEAMFYNRTLLIGLDLQDDNVNDGNPLDDEYLQSLTWEEFFGALCPAIMKYNAALPEDKKILDPSADYAENYAILGYDSDDNLFITLAEQYGLGYTALNPQTGSGSIEYVLKNAQGKFAGVSEEWQAVVQMLADAYQKHYFTTKGVIGKNCNYVSTTGGANSNGAGMLFTVGSTGGIKYQFSDARPYDVGVAPIPQAEGLLNQDAVISQGPSIAFMKRGANEKIEQTRALGTWLFYKELIKTDIATEWATVTGYSPLRDSVATSPEYIKYASTEGKQPKTLDILKARNAQYVPTIGSDLFTSPVFPGSSKARTSVSGILADIFKGCAGMDVTGTEFANLVKAKFEAGYNNAI